MAEFQTQVNVVQAPAVAGDFSDGNPRSFYPAGPGGLVVGISGVTVGRFAWVSGAQLDVNGSPALVNSFGSGKPSGFVHRSQQALITAYLDASSMLVRRGFGIELLSKGGVFAKNEGAAACLVGMKAYASLTTGAIRFGVTGSPTAGGAATGSIAASTFSATGSIADEVMTVTAVGSGVIVNGATISGTGVSSGSKVVAQLSGTAGGIGTYQVSIPEQTVASTTISGTYGTFTAASALTGAFVLGGVLTGTGISVPTTITQFLTGTGGLGTYVVDVNTVVASTTISQTGDVETDFTAYSAGLTGELVKISNAVV